MNERSRLPEAFLRDLKALELAYLKSDDPIEQSSFGGGKERWRAEREPILEAVAASGDLLDVGCANGYLLECLVAWGLARAIELTPYGVDRGEQLIALARRRLPRFAANFFVGNAWDWEPPKRFRYVYSLYDCVPPDYLGEYVARLLSRVVAPGGRLIIGAYGSRSRGLPPFDIAGFLRSRGFNVVGASQGGEPAMTGFAWLDA